MLAILSIFLLISLGQCAQPEVQPPTLSSNQPEEVVTGSEVTLTCTSELGDDDSKAYTFYKNSEIVRNASSDNTYTSTVELESFAAAKESATYECVVMATVNGSSSSLVSNSYRLSVVLFPEAPIMTPDQVLEVQLGSPLTINCETTTGGAIVYTFYILGINDRLEILQTSDSTTYTIQDFSMQDYGTYVCYAEGPGPVSKTFAVQSPLLLTPVQATLSSNLPQEVCIGSELTLTCASETGDDDSKKYTFYKNREIVRDLSSDNTYTVESLTRDDSAYYECVVTATVNGSSSSLVSNGYRLSVVPFPDTPSLIPAGKHEAQIGSSLTIKCETTTGGPIIYKFSLHLTRGSEYPVKVLQTSDSTTYTIHNITMDDFGTYVCYAEGPILGSYALDSLFLVPTPQATLNSNQPINVVSGSELTLTCTSELGDDDSKVYTFYNNGEIVRDASSDNTYTVESLSRDDSGTYVCLITATVNGSSSSLVSNHYVLAVAEFPRTPSLKPAGKKEVQLGSSLTLTCETTTGGSILYTFYIEYDNGDTKTLQSSDSTTYTIQDISMEDYGRYVCYASSPMYSTYAWYSLRLEPPPLATLSSNQSKEVVNGSGLILTCTSETGDDDSKLYTFYKNREIVRDASTDNTYTVESLTRDDSGTYVCLITATVDGSSASLVSNEYQLSVVAPSRSAVPQWYLDWGRKHGSFFFLG